MSENGKFEFSATLEAAQAAEYLSRIADGLRRGVVALTAGGRSIRLEPTAMMAIEIEAETKPEKSKGSLGLEISWKAERAAAKDTLAITVDPRDEAAPAPSRSKSRD